MVTFKQLMKYFRNTFLEHLSAKKKNDQVNFYKNNNTLLMFYLTKCSEINHWWNNWFAITTWQSRHAPCQPRTLLSGDFMPFLVQQFKQLSFVWWLVAIHLPLNHIPELFSRVQVWRLAWPWPGIHLVVLHTHPDRPSWVALSTVLLEDQSSELGNIVRAEGSRFSPRITVYVAWFRPPLQRRKTLLFIPFDMVNSYFLCQSINYLHCVCRPVGTFSKGEWWLQ